MYAVSRGFAELYSHPSARLRGKNWLSLAIGDEKSLLEKGLVQAKAGKLVRLETVCKINGDERTISWLFYPLPRNRLAAEGTEITKLDARERWLVKTAKMAVLTETVTALAHEFNQPLNIMRLAAANALAAMKNGDNAKALSKLKRIQDQLKRAASLVEAVRSLKTVGGKRRFAVEATVRRLLASFRELLLRRRITLSLRTENVAGVKLFGSPELFELMLTNLLVNAKEAVLAVPPPGRIILCLKGNKEWLELVVRDNGVGIAADSRPHLFAPFFTSKSRQGSGLGLAMVHNIASDMGGRVEVGGGRNGGEFSGSEFKVVLPLKGGR